MPPISSNIVDRTQESTATAAADLTSGRRFVQRIHRLRTLGLALGFLCVASVLRLHDEPLGWWLLLATNAFLWPHIARWLAMRSTRPRHVELRSLMVDSALGGLWIAVMQFNVLPSVLLATMLSVDKISAGGPPLLARTLMLLAVACALASAALGFPLGVVSPMSVVVACLPLLVIYPLAISSVTHALTRRVAQQNRRLEEMGRTDGLTGLANRRKIFAVVEAELARHRRTGRPAVLVMLDIDRFKDINDRYGHPAGDEVLRGVADVLRQCCRATDMPSRYGGDEFLMLLPETDLRGAEEMALRVRRQLEVLAFAFAPNLRCTVSLGASAAKVDLTDVNAWIQRADAALYRAKAAGRDRFAGRDRR